MSIIEARQTLDEEQLLLYVTSVDQRVVDERARVARNGRTAVELRMQLLGGRGRAMEHQGK